MTEYRYWTADLLGGDMLADWLPLADVSFSRQVNGAGAFKAKLDPRQASVAMLSQLMPGRTALVVERAGQLRWSGIVWLLAPDGPSLAVEAAGWPSYLHRRHDLHGNAGNPSPWIGADPLAVVRTYMAYIADPARFADGDLGWTVDPTVSPVRVGTADKPYKVDWWDVKSVADIIEELRKEGDGFEWSDSETFDGARVRPRLVLGQPRIGARRQLAVRSGVNVYKAVPTTFDADTMAQTVIGLGAGEGSAMLRQIDSVADGTPRLEAVMDWKWETSPDRLRQRTAARRTALSSPQQVSQVTILDTADCPFSAVNAGDELWCAVHEEWADFEAWCRVDEWTETPGGTSDPDLMALTLIRADMVVS